MPRRACSTRLFVLALGLAIAPGPAAFAASPAPKDAMPATTSDPNAWLEDVTGAKPLAVSDCLNFGSPEDPGVVDAWRRRYP